MQKGTIFFDKPIYIGASFRIIEAINVWILLRHTSIVFWRKI
jgi:hypothetical protein